MGPRNWPRIMGPMFIIGPRGPMCPGPLNPGILCPISEGPGLGVVEGDW